jgi:serine/threonine protein kinase
LNVGDVIGEYRLSFRLGEGPRGVVWRASRIDRVQNAILKVIKPTGFELGRPIQKAFERLTLTLTQLGRLDHPNLAAVIGTARRTQDGLFGVASEYLEARNLDVFPFRSADARTIVDDPSAFANLLGVMEQLASLVMWLHRSGTHHGDIKPSNVLVVPTDHGLQVKLTDLIWAQAGFAGFTEYQKAYMPPEYIAGHDTTPASDQWAVAKIIHQLVVKGSPGRSQTEALSALPVDLLKVIQRALDANPSNRFPAMAPLVDALRQLRLSKQNGGDPHRIRAHQIGYSPTTPVSAHAVSEALAEKHNAPTEDMPPIKSRDITERELAFGAINPAADVRAPVQPLRKPARRNEGTDIVPVDDDDFDVPRSNALSWVAIVVASAAIVIAGGYLILGFGGDDAPAISAAPPSPPPPPKLVDEPLPPVAPPPPAVAPPSKPVRPPPPPRPAAGARGVEIAKKCIAGKSSACLEAGEMFLDGKGGLNASKTEALALFDRACTLHSLTGCHRAADVLVEMGEGKRARRLYEKACDSASAHSCDKLSGLWREGIGGAKNERTADAFANRACQLGRKSSCK